MQTEMVSTLLLPLGIWLILSAATPAHLQRRLAATSLLALGMATLAFGGFGFALMFGGLDAAPGGAATPWILFGTRGFFLAGATDATGLARFISAWPLVAACAIVLAGALAARARSMTVVVLTSVVTGVAFSIAGCWLWGAGWLQALGPNAGLGSGAIDLGRISAVGLVAGAAALAWIGALPRREVAHEAELPSVHFPARAVAGVLCVLIGSLPAGVTPTGADPALVMGQFVNTSLAVSAAILTAGAYTIFTTRNADVLTASRAALAAVFVASSGAALMPVWSVIALGVACGLLATVGYYAVCERLRWADESGVVSCALIPAAAGMLATGVLASGSFGVSGLLPQAGRLSDPGQLVVQASAVIAIAALGWGLCSGVIALARRLNVALVIPPEVSVSPSPAPAPATVATAEWTASVPEFSVTYTQAPLASSADAANAPAGEAAAVEVEAPQPSRRRGILTWLRGSSAVDDGPRQPRRTAYPYRVAGRRLATRPVTPASGDLPAPDATAPANPE